MIITWRGNKMWLIYFTDNGCRGREKIIEEKTGTL